MLTIKSSYTRSIISTMLLLSFAQTTHAICPAILAEIANTELGKKYPVDSTQKLDAACFGDFYADLAKVALYNKNDKTIRMGFINSKGQIAIPPLFISASNFDTNYAHVTDKNREEFNINTKGEKAPPDIAQENIAPVPTISEPQAQQWLITPDHLHKIAIPAQYKHIHLINPTLAIVVDQSEKIGLAKIENNQLKEIMPPSLVLANRIVRRKNAKPTIDHDHISSFFDSPPSIKYSNQNRANFLFINPDDPMATVYQLSKTEGFTALPNNYTQISVEAHLIFVEDAKQVQVYELFNDKPLFSKPRQSYQSFAAAFNIPIFYQKHQTTLIDRAGHAFQFPNDIQFNRFVQWSSGRLNNTQLGMISQLTIDKNGTLLAIVNANNDIIRIPKNKKHIHELFRMFREHNGNISANIFDPLVDIKIKNNEFLKPIHQTTPFLAFITSSNPAEDASGLNNEIKKGIVTQEGKIIRIPDITEIYIRNQHAIIHTTQGMGILKANGEWLLPIDSHSVMLHEPSAISFNHEALYKFYSSNSFIKNRTWAKTPIIIHTINPSAEEGITNPLAPQHFLIHQNNQLILLDTTGKQTVLPNSVDAHIINDHVVALKANFLPATPWRFYNTQTQQWYATDASDFYTVQTNVIWRKVQDHWQLITLDNQVLIDNVQTLSTQKREAWQALLSVSDLLNTEDFLDISARINNAQGHITLNKTESEKIEDPNSPSTETKFHDIHFYFEQSNKSTQHTQITSEFIYPTKTHDRPSRVSVWHSQEKQDGALTHLNFGWQKQTITPIDNTDRERITAKLPANTMQFSTSLFYGHYDQEKNTTQTFDPQGKPFHRYTGFVTEVFGEYGVVVDTNEDPSNRHTQLVSPEGKIVDLSGMLMLSPSTNMPGLIRTTLPSNNLSQKQNNMQVDAPTALETTTLDDLPSYIPTDTQPTNNEARERYTFITPNLKTLTQSFYDEARPFVNGFAQIRKGTTISYINTSGKIIASIKTLCNYPVLFNAENQPISDIPEGCPSPSKK